MENNKLSLFDIAMFGGEGGGGVSDYNDIQNKPSINSVTLSGNKSLSDLGIVNKALKPMKSAWCGSNLTTAQAASAILADSDTQVGDGFLGGVEWSDISSLGLGNAEVKAFVISGDIVQFEMTSADTKPYAWFYNSAGAQWRSYVPIYNGLDHTTTTEALSANMGKSLKDTTNAIEAKIPSQASAQNQLGDKSFINSSIATNTAYFIGTFNSVAELEAYTGVLTNNDYAFVVSTDTSGNTVYNRYKYRMQSGAQGYWAFEYALNNSSFTAVQWATIQSGLVAADKTKLDGIETGAEVNVLEGVQVNGTDLAIDANKKVNIPIASNSTLGVAKYSQANGIDINTSTGMPYISRANAPIIAIKTEQYKPITPADLDVAIKEGLGNYNLGTGGANAWSTAYQSHAREVIGAFGRDGATTLDATLVAGKQYLLGSKSATFGMVLPATGTYNEFIEVVFTAAAAFTPTTSGGTVVGDTIPATVANKTYDYLFTYVGNGAWLFQYLAW